MVVDNESCNPGTAMSKEHLEWRSRTRTCNDTREPSEISESVVGGLLIVVVHRLEEEIVCISIVVVVSLPP